MRWIRLFRSSNRCFCFASAVRLPWSWMALPIYEIIYLSIVWNGVVIYLHSDYSSMHECLCDRLIVLCSVARCVGSFGSIIASKSFVNCCICMLSDAVVIVLRSTCDETACSENYKENSVWGEKCCEKAGINVFRSGLKKPLGTGPVTAVTGLTGPDRFRFRPVQTGPKFKF